MTAYFIQAFIYLSAAVIMVPLAKRFGLGSVLGYLIAGVIIGPVIGLVGEETQTLQHFAEFGVVMMLFLVGLELEPRMLWQMRHRLIGLGGLQVAATAAVITAIAMSVGIDWRVGLTVGLILCLSSTAIVLQTLNEKGLSKTEGGRSAFSVLLFQDIAVIPMLALIPLLEMPALSSTDAQSIAEAHESIGLLAGLSNSLYAVVVVAAIAAVILAGHYLTRPLFRYVAKAGLREVFTAATLMLVIGIAALMSLVGLSPALGVFLAGVVLANSEFRHELENNIEPFKGLLLGLFFITVGAGINFSILADNFLLVIAITFLLILVKAFVLYLLAIAFKIKGSDRWLLTLSLAQAGEFGFVLLAFSVQNHVLSPEISDLLLLVVAMSMFLSPALFIFFDKVLLPKFEKASNDREADKIEETGDVLIAGSGRFGQIVNRLLVANGVKTTVLDHEVQQIEVQRTFGIKSYYGDATQPGLLHTAGIEEATLFIAAIDNKQQMLDMVKNVRQNFPQLPIIARAYDEVHSYALEEAGADLIIKETYYSALELGGEALKHVGVHPFRAEQLKYAFLQTEQQCREGLFQKWKENTNEAGISSAYRDLFLQLEQGIRDAMQYDRSDAHSRTERGWTPPPRHYAELLDEQYKKERVNHDSEA